MSGGDKVCKTIPYIYVCVCARARTHGGLFFKIVKTENLAMLDRILPYEILNAISSFQHNNTAKVLLIKLISFSLILKVQSHYLMLTHLFFFFWPGRFILFRKFHPIMNMKEIKSLTKNLEHHIHQWNKHQLMACNLTE